MTKHAQNSVPGELISTKDKFLASFFNPLKLQDFADDYWAKRPLLVKNAVDEAFLSLSDPLIDIPRLLLDERLLQVTEARIRNAKSNMRPVPEGRNLQEIMDSGNHLQFRNLQKVLPAIHPIVHLANTLQSFLGHPLDSITTILSPKHSQMISGHFDLTEIFTIQVHGSKVWYIQLFDQQDPLELVVDAGDLLYVPARFRHKVLSSDTSSTSYALVYRPIRLDTVLAEIARDVASADPEYWSTLPLLGEPLAETQVANGYASLLKTWGERLQQLDSESLFWKARQLALIYSDPWPNEMRYVWENITESTAIERSSKALPAIDYYDDSIHFTIGGGVSLEIPGAAVLEVAALLSTVGVIAAQDAARIASASQVVMIIRSLLQLGLLQMSAKPRDPSEDDVTLRGAGWSAAFVAHFGIMYALWDPNYKDELTNTPRSALRRLCKSESLAVAGFRFFSGLGVDCFKSAQKLREATWTVSDIRMTYPESYER